MLPVDTDLYTVFWMIHLLLQGTFCGGFVIHGEFNRCKFQIFAFDHAHYFCTDSRIFNDQMTFFILCGKL